MVARDLTDVLILMAADVCAIELVSARRFVTTRTAEVPLEIVEDTARADVLVLAAMDA